jgi:hypothetical protein
MNGQPTPLPDETTPQATAGERRCRDRRAPWRMWIPTYVLRYIEKVGSHGVTLYALLAWHCTRESAVRWPSMNQLARAMHVSRSTVERTMRLLKEVELVRTTPCKDATGQHSNYFDLIDPPEQREQTGSHGTEIAGAFTDEPPPLSPGTGGDVSTDGAPLSLVTAPSVEELREEGEREGAATLTPGAAQRAEKWGEEINKLAALWSAQLPPGPERWKETHNRELRWWAEHLLVMGYTASTLQLSINDPTRKRGEWPREWGERVEAKPPKPTKTPVDPRIERQKAIEHAERARASRQAAGNPSLLAHFLNNIGQPVDGPSRDG